MRINIFLKVDNNTDELFYTVNRIIIRNKNIYIVLDQGFLIKALGRVKN